MQHVCDGNHVDGPGQRSQFCGRIKEVGFDEVGGESVAVAVEFVADGPMADDVDGVETG